MKTTVFEWLKKKAPLILSCLGAGGVVYTAVLAAKATPKAIMTIDYAEREKFSKGGIITWKERILPAAEAYLPAAAVGAGTIACILGANALNQKQQASLISAYAALDQAFREYRGKVLSLAGVETDHAVMNSIREEHKDQKENNPPWEVVQTFYLEGYPRFFDLTMEQVARAEYCLNRNFVLRGYVTFNEFLHFLGLDDLGEKGEHIGWEAYIGEAFYGYQWIDFDHIHRVSDEGFRVCGIEMPFPPHSFDDSLYEGEASPTCGLE